MKPRYSILVTLLLLSFLFTVYAVWIATDNFDSYSVATTLEGASGGSSWTSNWDNTPNTGWTSETAPAGGQGGVAARHTGTTSEATIRTFSSLTAGSVSFRVRISATSGSYSGITVRLGESGQQARMNISISSTGNISLFDNDLGDWRAITAYSIDTWYRVDIEFDDIGQPDKFRARVDGGTWTSWYKVSGATYALVDQFMIDDAWTGSHTFWVDDISATSTQSPVPLFKRYYDLLRD